MDDRAGLWLPDVNKMTLCDRTREDFRKLPQLLDGDGNCKKATCGLPFDDHAEVAGGGGFVLTPELEEAVERLATKKANETVKTQGCVIL